MLDQLGTGPVIAVGYSMGGPVAQLLWRRHPDKVSGLVLAATSDSFIPGHPAADDVRRDDGGSRPAPPAPASCCCASRAVGPQLALRQGRRPETIRRWAPQEIRRHDMRMVFEAGNAIATFSSRRWIRHVDVPTAVLVTTKDRADQSDGADAAGPAHPRRVELHRYDEGHTSPVLESFGPAVTDACLEVARDVALVDASVSRLRPLAGP